MTWKIEIWGGDGRRIAEKHTTLSPDPFCLLAPDGYITFGHVIAAFSGMEGCIFLLNDLSSDQMSASYVSPQSIPGPIVEEPEVHRRVLDVRSYSKRNQEDPENDTRA